MEQYHFFINIVIYSIVPSLFSLYVTEKVKGSVKNSFDRKLEEAKKEHSIEISKFQTELNSLKAKENYKFTKLHEKRFEVLQETYSYLNKTLRLLHIYVSPMQSTPTTEFKLNRTVEDILKEQDVSVEFETLYNEFSSYIQNNSIFFDEKIENLLEEYFTKSGDVFLLSYSSKSLQKLKIGDDEENQKVVDLMYGNIFTLVIPIKKEIEIKFRELLGE